VDRSEAQEIITTYMVEQFDVPREKVVMEAKLFDDLELDSIDALDMVGLLEARLGVQVDEDEIKKIRTIADVVAYIVDHAP
jgi:acyl carrier protein